METPNPTHRGWGRVYQPRESTNPNEALFSCTRHAGVLRRTVFVFRLFTQARSFSSQRLTQYNRLAASRALPLTNSRVSIRTSPQCMWATPLEHRSVRYWLGTASRAIQWEGLLAPILGRVWNTILRSHPREVLTHRTNYLCFSVTPALLLQEKQIGAILPILRCRSPFCSDLHLKPDPGKPIASQNRNRLRDRFLLRISIDPLIYTHGNNYLLVKGD